MEKLYEFSVSLDDRQVRVVARDKLSASKQGAHALGVIWKERARDLIIIQGREIRRSEQVRRGLVEQESAKKPKTACKGQSANTRARRK